ncbi:MAG: DUF3892 domain-containing protein [Armatimonadetes bacterium]|nr:MAG: DUF3892 domain-containing protein [Armatimonadota bacterium]
MAIRKVTHTRKHNGQIVALGNPEEWWSPRSVIDAAVDIVTRLHRYYVTDTTGRIVPVKVLAELSGDRIHAPGTDDANLLRFLPDC